MNALRKLFIALLVCFVVAFCASGFNLSELASAVGISGQYDSGYDAGYQDGLELGTESGYKNGYEAGYNDGLNDAKSLYRLQTSSQQSSSVSKSSSSSSASYVYVTDTGSKYHKAGCSYLKSSNKITLSDAKNWGYTPCSRCY